MTGQTLSAPLLSGSTPSFSRQMTGFVSLLRENGFVVGIREMLDAMEVLDVITWSEPRHLRAAWRAVLCSRQADWQRFDDLFDAWWLRLGLKSRARISGMSNRASKRRTLNDLGGNGGSWKVDHVEQDGDENGRAAESDSRNEGASRGESLEAMDMRHVHDPEQLAKAGDIAENLARRMLHRLARRDRATARGRRLDLRRVIRSSSASGGMPMRLFYRHRTPRPLRLVMLMDASGSMNQYGAFFLRFMRGALDSFHEADAFVFHTKLVHIGDVMRERNAEKAIERLSLMTTGWSGGTRIGESLEAFNRHYAKRTVHGRTVIMILSDGYDTSPPELLNAELSRLKKRAKSLVWLNPMMAWKGYEPVARGMEAALPHIDLLAPAHNLDSLAALEPYLAKL